ncbi:MAG: glycosyltransferase family 4 protein [Bacteroidetes bacterium]|nr:glycosyltransferase family 4 protein [Fibrella sp.]
MYVPPPGRLSVPPKPYHLTQRPWHTYFKPFLNDCRVWHAPFQSGRVLPDKAKFPDLKIVLTVHDLNVLYEDKPEAYRQQSLARTQALIDQSDAIVCISAFTRDDLVNHCRVGNTPVHIIYNGLNKLQDVAGEGVAHAPARFLLGIGYLNKKKNFHAVLPILQANPELALIIVGQSDDPDYVSYLTALARQLGVYDRLHLVGTVSEANKVWYLRHCRALVHPSLAEGFGLPVLEAMQFGKPVFLSRLTALPEVGGHAAFYFPSFEAEAVQETYRRGMKACESPERVAAIIEQAARFDWEKSARQYLTVYQSMMN